MKLTKYLAAVAALFLGSHLGHSAVSITLMEIGTNVVATGSGSVNLAGLTPISGDSSTDGIQPSIGYLAVGHSAHATADLYNGHSGPTSFGPGSNYVRISTGTGPRFNIHGTSNMRLPAGYVSGTEMTFESTWLNQSFDSLGVTPGIYTWTWGSGADVDSFTLTAVVPEPSTYAAIAGTLALGLAIWRRRKAA